MSRLDWPVQFYSHPVGEPWNMPDRELGLYNSLWRRLYRVDWQVIVYLRERLPLAGPRSVVVIRFWLAM